MLCDLSFFFNDTSTTEIYTYLHTLSLHDALPISWTTITGSPARGSEARVSATPWRTRSASAPCPSHSARRHCRPGRVGSGGAAFASTMPTPLPGGTPAASDQIGRAHV